MAAGITHPRPIALKRVSDTRWITHYASVKAPHLGIDGVVDTLNALCDSNEDLDTHGDVHGISTLDAIQSFTFFSFLIFWKVIRRESHEAQTNMQQKGLSLSQCSHELKAFVAFFNRKTR